MKIKMKPLEDANSHKEPQWYKMLPDHLKPPTDRIEKLENLRVHFDLLHNDFCMEIGTSKWAVIRTQEYTLNKLRGQFPHYSEKELLKELLLSRFRAKIMSPTFGDPPPEELLEKTENIDKIMENINTFQDLTNYILEMDKTIFNALSSIVQNGINSILSEGDSFQ